MHQHPKLTSNQIYASTKKQSKDIAKPNTPHLSHLLKQTVILNKAHKDKDMQKNLWLSLQVLQETSTNLPTDNLITSSNTRNKNVDTTPRYKNDQTDWTVLESECINVVGARDKLDKGVQLQAEQTDWPSRTDAVNWMNKSFGSTLLYKSKKQEFLMQTQALTAEPLEQWKRVISNAFLDSPDMCDK
ncbi:hypothetical protein Tco_0227152 [Tanacetum coccineum]